MPCKSNHWANDLTVVGFQVIVNFAFLIVFVFTYGQMIGRKEVTNQVNLVVDNVMAGLSPADYSALTGGETTAKMEAGITYLQSVINTGSQAAVVAQKANNKKVWKDSFLLYGGIVGGIIIVMLILKFAFGYCLGIKYAFFKAVIATVFIALTEVLLVNVDLRFIPFSRPGIKKAIGQTMNSYAGTKLAALAKKTEGIE